jgi:TRAP-type C4-dicarboxylate transport system permease small subunit
VHFHTPGAPPRHDSYFIKELPLVRNVIKIPTKLSEIAVIVLVLLITIDVLVGVFFRYILGNALSWNEELARYLMIWMGFIAASLVLKDEMHIGMTLFRDTLPPILRKLAILAGDVAIIIFLLVWCWASLETLKVIKDDVSPGLNIRLMWPLLAMPVCSGLMIFQQLTMIPHHVKMLRTPGNGTMKEGRG